MSGVAVLLGLLVLSYVGSMLVSGRTIRGFGLPSGAEYLVLGVVVGPHALGVLTRSTIASFEPIFVVGAAWLAFVAGLGYRVVGRRRVSAGRALIGVLIALAVGAAVAAVVFFALETFAVLARAERLPAALGAGVVSSETTRHTVRWVVERHGARGPVSDWVADMSRASALVPALGVAVLLAMAPNPPLASFGVLARIGIGVGIGVIMGLVATVLLGREFRRDESWGLLLGASLLGAGVAMRLGLSTIATLFVMGLTLSVISRHRLEIKLMVQPTEKPVMLPVLLVAGACIDFQATPKLGWIVAAAIATRILTELVRGWLVAAVVPTARPAWAEVGLGMTSTGALSLAAAFTLGVRAPGASSGMVLAIAAAAVLAGEMMGPALLRRAIERAGEAHAVDTDDASPLSLPPPPAALSDHPEPS